MLLNTPCPPFSMLGYDREITPTNTYILFNIRSKSEEKSSQPSQHLTMFVVYVNGLFQFTLFSNKKSNRMPLPPGPTPPDKIDLLEQPQQRDK